MTKKQADQYYDDLVSKIVRYDAVYKYNFLKFFKEEFRDYLIEKLTEDELSAFLLFAEVSEELTVVPENIVRLSNEFINNLDKYSLFAYRKYLTTSFTVILRTKELRDKFLNTEKADIFNLKFIPEKKREEIEALSSIFSKAETIFDQDKEKKRFAFSLDLEDLDIAFKAYDSIMKKADIFPEEFLEKYKKVYDFLEDKIKLNKIFEEYCKD